MDIDAVFRFYEELNDFLPPERKKVSFTAALAEGLPVGEAISRLGVPVEEVDLVLVNDESVGLPEPLAAGDRVSVYPAFESFDISALGRVRTRPLRRIAFIVAPALRELAGSLRRAGVDAVYCKGSDEEAVVTASLREARTILTTDPALLDRAEVTRAYVVRSADPARQLVEVLRRFDLAPGDSKVQSKTG